MKNLSSYGLQNINGIDINKIRSSLKKDIITNGNLCKNFEKKLAKILGSKYVVSCNNGTSALMMSILALNLKNVVAIVPSINFVAIANIISLIKGKIIFCDINYSKGMVDENSLELILNNCKKKNIKPNIFIPMHYAGNTCNLKSLSRICKKNKIKIIEDGCHSFGSKDNENNYIGKSKYSSFTTFSFHPVKNITTIEGGAIATNSFKLYNRLKMIRTHNLNKTDLDDPYRLLGPSLNFRMGEINALIGLQQIKKMNFFKNKRIMLVNYYIKRLSKFEKHFDIINFNSKKKFWHLFSILLKGKLRKRKLSLMKFLKKNKIATQIHYKPLFLHGTYEKIKLLENTKYSNRFYKSQLTLPLHVNMNKKDIIFVEKKINIFINKL